MLQKKRSIETYIYKLVQCENKIEMIRDFRRVSKRFVVA